MKQEQTNIEWAHYTFNPVRGCARVSQACDHCYAETMSRRNPAILGRWGTLAEGGTRVVASESMWQSPVAWNAQAKKEGRRFRVFCASLADVFDPEWPAGVRERLLHLIDATPCLDWLLLTKRPELIEPLMQDAMHGNFDRLRTFAEHMPNVWLGVTAENQQRAAERVPVLMDIGARVRFLSCEPLLSGLDLTRLDDADNNRFNALTGAIGVEGRGWTSPDRQRAIHWVIAGGESGPGARPAHPDWFRGLRDQCQAAGVPFLFKQWGDWLPSASLEVPVYKGECRPLSGCHTYRVGKEKAGRTLDGVTWTQFPELGGVTA